MSTPHVARAFALLNVAQADAGNAAWDCKYALWSPRPVNAVRDLGLDPNFTSFLPTPVFPSYISGHSTYSAAASDVLSYLFPVKAAGLQGQGPGGGGLPAVRGIHYRSDNEVGLQVGAEVGQFTVARARQDGADSGSSSRATANSRPSATPSRGAGVNFDTPPSSVRGARKSQPYWTPLVTIEGLGEQHDQDVRRRPWRPPVAGVVALRDGTVHHRGRQRIRAGVAPQAGRRPVLSEGRRGLLPRRGAKPSESRPAGRGRPSSSSRSTSR